MSSLSRHRFPLVVGLVLLVVAVIGLMVWSQRGDSLSRPLMITPAFAVPSSSPPPSSPSATPSHSSSASVSPSPSVSSTAPVLSESSASGRRVTPSPSRTTPAPAPALASFDAQLSVEGGFFGQVRGVAVVANQGAAASGWSLVIDIPGVRMTSARDATTSGSTATFTGSSMAPGKSVTVSFRGTMTSRDVGPVTCSIQGGSCEITTRGIPE